jgi:hypothetical protein
MERAKESLVSTLIYKGYSKEDAEKMADMQYAMWIDEERVKMEMAAQRAAEAERRSR